MLIQGRIAAIGVGVALCAISGCRIDEDPSTVGEGEACPCEVGGTDTAADQYCVPFCDRLEACGLVSVDAGSACLSYCETQYNADPSDTQNGCQCVTDNWCGTINGPNAYDCPGAPIPPTGLVGGTSSEGGGSSGGTNSEGGSSSSGISWGTTGSNASSTAPNGGGSSGTTGASPTSGTAASTSTGGTTGASSSGGGSTSSSSSSGSTGSAPGGATTCTENINCADDQDCVDGVCLQRCTASCECATGQSCVNNYCYTSVPPPTSCTVDCECNAGQSCVDGACQ